MATLSSSSEAVGHLQVDVHTPTGTTNGTVELDEAIFGVTPNVGAMHQVVTAQLAAARAGTSKTRNRSEVRGGGKKPWRQKGTGRARQGSTRAPQWVGGGIAHGPTGEENYTKRVSKKLKRLALRSALSDRASSGDVRVVVDLRIDTPKTKDAIALLRALDLEARRVLLVLATQDVAVARSFRNLPAVHVLTVDQLNTYDVLCSDVVVFQQEALEFVGTGERADLRRAPAAAGTETDTEEVSA
jgi:large subunit ribosomal protein L4